jgi:hypothetical protein
MIMCHVSGNLLPGTRAMSPSPSPQSDVGRRRGAFAYSLSHSSVRVKSSRQEFACQVPPALCYWLNCKLSSRLTQPNQQCVLGSSMARY